MHSKPFIRLSRFLTISVLSIVMMGCFDTGDGKRSTTGSATGKLTFSKVSGITFKTPSREGVTGADSAFGYFPGETVTFAIGDINDGIILGSVAGTGSITAVELTGSTDPGDTAAANMIRFIHSLDDNQNPYDGVFITEAVRDAANNLPPPPLDFSSEDFTQLAAAILFLTGNPPVDETTALYDFCFGTYLPQGGESVFGFPYDACKGDPDPQELLLNRSFEEDSGKYEFYIDPDLGFPLGNRGFFPSKWRDGFNQFYDEGDSYVDTDGVTKSTYPANTGIKSLRLAGPDFFTMAYPEPNATIVDQEFIHVAGETYTASIMALNSGGSLYPPNAFNLVFIFSCDGVFDDDVCDYEFTTTANGDPDEVKEDVVYLPPDVWTEVTLTATAPLDTVAARLRIAHIQFPRSAEDTETPGNIPLADLSALFVDDASVIGPTVAEADVEYVEVWREDFDTDGGVADGALNNWNVETGYGPNPPGPGWGNEEWQLYTDDPRDLYVENGLLKITANCDYLENPANGAGSNINVLSNAGFASPDASTDEVPSGGTCDATQIGSPGWTASNCNVVRNTAWTLPPFSIEQSPRSHDGDGQVLKQFGNSEVYQEVAASPEQAITAVVYAMNWNGTFQELFSNLARLQILFIDSGNSVIGQAEVTAAPVAGEDYQLTPQVGAPGDWTQMEVSAVAPDNTVSARLVLKHEVTTGSSTAPIWWDDASLTVSEPVCNVTTANGGRNGAITSARINTLGNMDPILYGKIEARIKVPVDKGAWPAFWMLGTNFSDVGWPRTGEIDIMEVWTTLGSDDKTTHATLHWCDEASPSYDEVDCFPGGKADEGGQTVLEGLPSLGDDFHVYTVEWNSRRFLFKIDGNLVWSALIEPDTMEEFNRPFYIILNLAMGGTLGSGRIQSGNLVVDPPFADGSNWDLPQTMEVDWVSVSRSVIPGE